MIAAVATVATKTDRSTIAHPYRGLVVSIGSGNAIVVDVITGGDDQLR